MNLLEKALEIALDAHRNQVDFKDNPFILHILEIMTRLNEEPLKICALLSEAVNTRGIDLYYLEKRGFPDEIIQALTCLQPNPDGDFDAYISRVSYNRIARLVTIATLDYSLDIKNRDRLKPEEFDILNMYLKAVRKLRDKT